MEVGSLKLEKDPGKMGLRSLNVAWKRGSWGWHIPVPLSNVSAPIPYNSYYVKRVEKVMFWAVYDHQIVFIVSLLSHRKIFWWILWKLMLMLVNFETDNLWTKIIWFSPSDFTSWLIGRTSTYSKQRGHISPKTPELWSLNIKWLNQYWWSFWW